MLIVEDSESVCVLLRRSRSDESVAVKVIRVGRVEIRLSMGVSINVLIYHNGVTESDNNGALT